MHLLNRICIEVHLTIPPSSVVRGGQKAADRYVRAMTGLFERNGSLPVIEFVKLAAKTRQAIEEEC
jgi:hypothetical protein